MVYEFDLLVEGYKSEALSWFIIFLMVVGTSFLFVRNEFKKTKWCFLIVTFFMIASEVFGLFRYYQNINALKTGKLTSVKGCIGEVDRHFQLRVTSEMEHFFVGGVKVSFSVKGDRFAYSVPISKNRHIRHGNYFDGYLNEGDLVKLKIFEDLCE